MTAIPSALAALQPATAEAYRRATATVLPLVDERLLALCQEQLQATQQRRVWQPPTDCNQVERQALVLAEQFAVDVNGIHEAHVAALTDVLGDEALVALVNSLYLVDMTLRLELVAPKILPGHGAVPVMTAERPAHDGSADPGALIANVIADFAAAAVLADGIDPLTSEIVRLRCAQVHHCRLCGSLRQRSALDHGFDETMTDRIAHYEQGGFNEAATGALRLVDTLILFPADASDELKAELERHYSPEQIAELCFDIVKWSQQKALVAMHSDAPPWEGVHVLNFDGDGHPQFEGPVVSGSDAQRC